MLKKVFLFLVILGSALELSARVGAGRAGVGVGRVGVGRGVGVGRAGVGRGVGVGLGVGAVGLAAADDYSDTYPDEYVEEEYVS